MPDGPNDRQGRDLQIADVWREHRPYLVDLAFRMLGNIHDAEDMVQDAFGRLLDQDLDQIDDVRGWLVVVVSRRCLDDLRSARSRRQTHTPALDEEPATAPPSSVPDPADRVTLDDSIRMALLVVLQRLSPAERAVFVLHDVFQFSFEAVASIVGRTPAACRQIASRARRRIEADAGPARFDVDTAEQHRVAERFIAACSGGDIEALMELLDADAVGDVDVGMLGPPPRPIRGGAQVARNLLRFFGPRTGTTLVSQPVPGHDGLLAFREGQLVGIVRLDIRDGLIHDLHAVADPQKLAFVSTRLGEATSSE